MKVTLKILLAAAVVLLVYMCYKSVTGPIEYDDQKTIRDNAIIARLIAIQKRLFLDIERKGAPPSKNCILPILPNWILMNPSLEGAVFVFSAGTSIFSSAETGTESPHSKEEVKVT